jgi:cellulose synthase/poly-beta-1,6-N-acetylglucosamine synthase-like glycosyltransferase
MAEILSQQDDPPAISVIIPVFNRADSLRRAVASVASELGPRDEILVVDDASDPPVDLSGMPFLPCNLRVLRSDRNGGPAAARNRGVEAAQGALIAFLDSDDEWLPGKIAAQRAMLGKGDMAAVACGWRETLEGREFRVRMPVPSRSGSDFFAGCWFCPGSTLMLTRATFDAIGPLRDDIRRLEDYEWFLRFGKAGGRLLVADVIGASIARGGNARPALVEQAAAMIASEIDRTASPGERTDLRAYFDLERAGAFRNVGDHARGAFYLGRSLLRRPRRQAALRRWWR